jgi:isopentenyl-diphosphate delta-isomerase
MREETQDLSHEKRKSEHLDISMNHPVQFRCLTTGFEKYSFIHQALPELNLEDVQLSTILFGKPLTAPIIISAMVGGIEAATTINRNLAQAAQSLGLAMGVGSQRCLMDTPDLCRTYQVRDIAPDILLLANLGAVQLNYGYGAKECLKLIETIDADALVLHLNPLQESIQPEGNTRFAGLLEKIRVICRELPVPVIVKVVGWGISKETAVKLAEAGVSGIDVAGAGGTCWSEIERRRSTDRMTDNIAEAFADWGIPTAESILLTVQGAPGLPVIASGGIRTGVDIAKAIALGADAAGIAAPLLKAADISADAVTDVIKTYIETLRIAMFCTGTGSIQELKFSPHLKKTG